MAIGYVERILSFQASMQTCGALISPSMYRGGLAVMSHDGLQSTQFVLSCRVLPMSWSSSVGVMQEASQKILHLGSLPQEPQLVRDKTVPLWMVGLVETAARRGKAWWHVYLDNFATGEISADGVVTEGERLHSDSLAEEAWRSSELTAQELGGYLDGTAQTLGASPERLLRLAQATLWLIGRPHMSKKLTGHCWALGVCISVSETRNGVFGDSLEIHHATWV